MRHGTAAGRLPEGSDHERRLTARGVREAEWTAGELTRLGWPVERVLYSDAFRTTETWWSMQPHFPNAVAQDMELLYRADVDALLDLMGRQSRFPGVVLWIGHNPTWSQVVSLMAGESRSMKPATAACLELPGGIPSLGGWSGGANLCHWLVPPGDGAD